MVAKLFTVIGFDYFHLALCLCLGFLACSVKRVSKMILRSESKAVKIRRGMFKPGKEMIPIARSCHVIRVKAWHNRNSCMALIRLHPIASRSNLYSFVKSTIAGSVHCMLVLLASRPIPRGKYYYPSLIIP